jgi:transcriptional regulator with XRE-family HTH domain
LAAPTLPIPVKSALRKLGSDIRDARLRRRIPTAVMAQRTFISRTTLVKVEKGDPGVGIGTYAAVLFALGLLDRLRDLASAKTDEIGLALEEERLPQANRSSSPTHEESQPRKRTSESVNGSANLRLTHRS